MLDIGIPRRSILAVGLLAVSCGGPSPTTVTATVIATAQVNPNSDNQPSPIVVRFFGLKSADTFNGATFFDLFDNETKTLGSDLLSRKEIEMVPGKTTKVDMSGPPDTPLLGVIAGYRDLENAKWRGVWTLSSGDSNALVVTLEARAMTLAKPRSGFLGIF
ncbi:MAG: type VI secretion system lipoprotein TssJ [Acetobacteraceae bacterium]